MRRLVLASGNPGKLREIRAMLAPLALDVVAQGALGVEEAEEPYGTFLENALAKARHASRASGLPALADDSGLCVPGLGGAPGVHSAYYAGREGDRVDRDARNNARLLAELASCRSRAGFYVCVLVLVHAAEDPRPLVAEGIWRGSIAAAPRGTQGFGYDPLFVPDGLAQTAAELDAATKNSLSHRALALAQLLRLLGDELD